MGIVFAPTRHGQVRGRCLAAWFHQGSLALTERRVWELPAEGRGALQGLLPPEPPREKPGQEELLGFVVVAVPVVACAAVVVVCAQRLVLMG